MELTITNKLTLFFVTLAMSFGVAFTALAYNSLEIEVDILSDTTEVEVSYQEDGAEVTEEYTYNTTDIAEVYTLLAAELELSEQEVEDSVTDVSDETEEADEAEEALSEVEDIEEDLAEASDAIAAAQAYIDSLDEESASTTIDELEAKLATAQGYLDEAQIAFDAEEYEEAEDLAKQAEDLAKEIFEDEDEEESDGDKTGNTNFCDKTKKVAGWGVAKKCVDNENFVINDKLANKIERFAEFGKSNDKAVLQNQLLTLLQTLIQLLEQQKALIEV